MTFSLYGVKTEATVWGGVVELAQDDSWFIAIVVLLASMVIPFFKLVALLLLSLSDHHSFLKSKRAAIYVFIEAIGRWSMLDIFLLAIMVSLIKLKGWAMVTVGNGAYAFAGVVIFTMLASACLSPQLLGEGEAPHA